MVSKVDGVLGMNFNADDAEEINIGNEASALANPYMHYPGGNEAADAGDSKPKAAKKKSSAAAGAGQTASSSANATSASSRPKSAARRTKDDK